MSAEGRINLAEHLRKLSLGFLSRRDPGEDVYKRQEILCMVVTIRMKMSMKL